MARRIIDPRSIDAHDPLVSHAINSIHKSYGDVVSVEQKGKGLLKFGRSKSIGTAGYETIWLHGGNEVYVNDNLIDRIVSNHASDSNTIGIEGHTVTDTGKDAQFVFTTREIQLNGQTPVLFTPVARTSRAYNKDGTELNGTIYVFEDTGVSAAGVPKTASKVHLSFDTGAEQSHKAATTFSNTDYFILTAWWASVEKKTTAVVDMILEVRLAGGVFRPITRMTLNTSAQTVQELEFKPYAIAPKNSDIRVRAIASANGSNVDSAFCGYLATTL